jgi:hypothetical protein
VDVDVRNVNDRGMKGRRMLPFRAQLRIFVVAAAASLAQPAWTQTYPTQNITLQVAFPAGGIADVVARLVGQKLSERFGHAVVVENRGGAGGNLAAKSVSGAAPDGYTILATTSSLAVNETDLRGKSQAFDTDEILAVRLEKPRGIGKSSRTLAVVFGSQRPYILPDDTDEPLTRTFGALACRS